jgi:hypothetical protein
MDAMEAHAKGKKVDAWIKSDDRLFDDSNAKDHVAEAY